MSIASTKEDGVKVSSALCCSLKEDCEDEVEAESGVACEEESKCGSN